MSGRRIRRPPAGTAAPARAPRQKDKARRVQRQVLATGAVILLAGTAATFLLEQAVLAPRRQVQTESALPVYSAVGQRTDDVSFWPWTFYAEQAGQTPTLFPMEGDAYTAEMLVTLIDALLGGGVASSSLLREQVKARVAARNRRIRLHFARPELSGDNAVGVALMGIDRLISTQKEAREHGGDVD